MACCFQSPPLPRVGERIQVRGQSWRTFMPMGVPEAHEVLRGNEPPRLSLRGPDTSEPKQSLD